MLYVTYYFYIYIEEELNQRLDTGEDIKTGSRRVEIIKFLDDTAVLAESEEKMYWTMKETTNVWKVYGVKINKLKV